MRRLSSFDTALRQAAEGSSSYRAVGWETPISGTQRLKKTVAVLFAGSLGSVACPTLAEPALSAAQEVSPVRMAATDTDPSATSSDVTAPEPWNMHGQFTFVKQYHPSFTSPYQGTNSLHPGSNGEETADLTLFAGVRLWTGGAFYINPEVDQGFGLSDTLGVAGFPSGEAYKVGKSKPYFRLQRAFLRQRFDLGGDEPADQPRRQ